MSVKKKNAILEISRKKKWLFEMIVNLLFKINKIYIGI